MTGEVIMQWQPIETAPEDGTRVLLFEAGRKVCIGEYVPAHSRHRGWCLEGWRNFYGHFFNPTHWMPLPLPPND